MDDSDVTKRRRQRFDFLVAVYNAVDGKLGPPGIRTVHLHQVVGGEAEQLFRLRADCEGEGWIRTRRSTYPGETNSFGVSIELTPEGRTMAENRDHP